VEELNMDVEHVLHDLEAMPPPMSHRERDIMMKRPLRKTKGTENIAERVRRIRVRLMELEKQSLTAEVDGAWGACG
jgi:hypothetical protein